MIITANFSFVVVVAAGSVFQGYYAQLCHSSLSLEFSVKSSAAAKNSSAFFVHPVLHKEEQNGSDF